jgi:uncharacterized membrane protein YhhN
MKLWQVAGLALFLLVTLVADAEAYLDPGTGSFVFQTIIAMVVGSLFALKTYWQRIKAMLSRQSATPVEDGPRLEQADGDRS